MSFSDAPISFPGLFGDWQFTVPSKALDIGNGVYWYGIIIAEKAGKADGRIGNIHKSVTLLSWVR